MEYIVPYTVITIACLFFFSLVTRDLPNRGRVLGMVAVAMLLRVALCTLFEAVPSTRLFHEDAEGYEWQGMRIAAYWHNEGPPATAERVSNYGYYYFTSCLYYIFGRYRLHAALWNSMFSCLSAILVYRTARLPFVEPVAWRAMLLALFFPSMVLWSAIASKDTVMLLLLVLCMYCVMQLKRRISFAHVGLATVTLLAILTVRFYMFYICGAAIVLSFTIFQGRRAGASAVNQILILGALGLAFVFLGLRQEASEGLSYFDFERISTLRAGLASTANSGWRGDTDVSSPGKAIAFMPFGIAFLLFSPFPWQFTSLRAILTLPEMLLWWSMTFAWWRGLRYVIRVRKKELMPIVIFAILLTMAYATVHGNVGVAFRQRSQIMVFLFILASLGKQLKELKARGLPSGAVERDAARKAT